MIKRFLFNVDLFGTPVAINFFGREKAKTSFGGVCSLLFFIFVGWALYNGSRDFFSTDNPTIISYEAYTEDPKEMLLSSDIFPLAFAVRAPSALSYKLYSNESIYKINLFHTLLQRIPNINGTIEEKWTETKVILEKCSLDYFGEVSSSFADLNLDFYYCISKQQPELEKIIIQGAFASPIYQTLTLEVSECNNATSEVPCAPQEVLDTYLSGGWFSALYTNMVVNPKDYKHPNSRYRDLYYTMFSPSNYKETEIELGNVQISTDAGWLVENIETKTYLRVNKVTEFLQFVPHPEKVLISCIFQPSKLENFYSRSYKKIQEVLAEVAGLANTTLIAAFFISSPFLKLKFREAMMNELFDIHMSAPIKKKKSKRKYIAKENDTKQSGILEKGKNLFSRKSKKKPKLTINSAKLSFQTPSSKSSATVVTSFSQVQSKLKVLNTKNNRPSIQINSQSNCTTPAMQAIQKGTYLAIPDIRPSGSSKLQHSKTFSVQTSYAEPEATLEKKDESITFNKDDLSRRKSVITDFEEARNTNEGVENLLSSHQARQDENTRPEFTEEKEGTRNSQITDRGLGAEEVKETTDIETIETKKVNLKVWEYVFSFICKPPPLREKIGVLENGIKNIDERLDVVNILKKLREFDKLRTLILDHDQLVLFNNLPKPQIKGKDESQLQRKVPLSHALLKSNFIEGYTTEEQILESYNNIKYKENKTEIDERLLQIFDGKN